jgi:hypothetical protein
MKKTTMTPEEAKAITLEVWEYLVEHPEVEFKLDLPKRLLKKIAGLELLCPLCELFVREDCICPCCPLGNCSRTSPYQMWANAPSKKARKINAQKIVDAVRAWEPEGEKPPAAKGRQRGRA